MTLNRTDITQKLRKEYDFLTVPQAKGIMELIVTSIQDGLVNGEKVSLSGLGTFEYLDGTDPLLCAACKKPAKTRRKPKKGVQFNAAKSLDDALASEDATG